jgi:ABC-2 type transport system permease protein
VSQYASSELAAPPVRPGIAQRVTESLGQSVAIIGLEARKLAHDPSELLFRAVQPALWLVIFGGVFSTIHVIPTGPYTYLQFLTPGILAQSVLFISIFYGIASIRERELGIITKFLVSPTPRVILVGARGLSASMRGLSQALIVMLLAIGLGVTLNFGAPAIAGVVVAVVLGSTLFSTLSMIIASIVKTQERFLGIGQLLTMPLFFASSATYLVDALRTLMLPGEVGLYPLYVDLGVLGGVTLLLILIESRLYPRMAQ